MNTNSQQRAEFRALARGLVLDQKERLDYNEANNFSYMLGGVLFVGIGLFLTIEAIGGSVSQGTGLAALAVAVGLLLAGFGLIVIRSGRRHQADLSADRRSLDRQLSDLGRWAGPGPPGRDRRRN